MEESELIKCFNEIVEKSKLIDTQKKYVCKVCGSSDLTFEHVPPKSTGNNNEFRKYDSLEFIKNYNKVDDIDYKNHQYQSQKKGTGGFYLCTSCNNRTGELYIKTYKKFHNVINDFFYYNIDKLEKSGFELIVEKSIDEYLKFAKQCILMEYISNNNTQMPEALKEWILDPQNNSLELDNVFVDIHIVNPNDLSYSFVQIGKFIKSIYSGCTPMYSTLLVRPFIIDAYDIPEMLENNILSPRFIELKGKNYVIFTSKNYNGMIPGMSNLSKREIEECIAKIEN